MRKQNGITLIALIITIIVLLILAGVTINLVVGQNGVLGKAQSAVSETKVAEAKQSTELLAADYQIEWYQNGLNRTQEKVGDYVKKKFEENAIIDSKYYIEVLDSDSGDENNPNRPFVLRLGNNIDGTIIASGYITDEGDILWDAIPRADANVVKVFKDPLALEPGVYTINTGANGNEYTLEQTWKELDESNKISYVSINYKYDKTLLSSIILEKSENRRCLVIDDTITTIFPECVWENNYNNIDEIVFPKYLKKIDDNAICSPITPYFKGQTTFSVGANNNFENLNYNTQRTCYSGRWSSFRS